jgi:hypothetical protein
MTTSDHDETSHHIPGWDRPAWAVRGVKDRDELTWTREASVDVTYSDGGVEETFAPELVRTDQVTIGEAGAAVHVGQTVIHFADDAYTTPGERRGAGRAVRLGGGPALSELPAVSAFWLVEALVYLQGEFER